MSTEICLQTFLILNINHQLSDSLKVLSSIRKFHCQFQTHKDQKRKSLLTFTSTDNVFTLLLYLYQNRLGSARNSVTVVQKFLEVILIGQNDEISWKNTFKTVMKEGESLFHKEI